MINEVKARYSRPGDYIYLGLKGFCMGMADIIPGISGGTIAFLLGIYEDLINAIRSFDLKFVRLLLCLRFREAFGSVAWEFCATVLIGIVGAILALSKIISWLLQYKPVFIYSFFFGLILATVPVIARIIKKWTAAHVLSVMLSAVVTYYFVGMVPLVTPEAYWFLFLSGAIAISAMILPGISGAFILVLLGKYRYILDAVNHRDLMSLGIFVLGIGVGIVTFVRVLSWLFNKYHDLTVTVITGIVIGSLRKIWPWKEGEVNIFPASLDGDAALAVGIMAVGFALALILNSSSDGKLVS